LNLRRQISKPATRETDHFISFEHDVHTSSSAPEGVELDGGESQSRMRRMTPTVIVRR